MNKSLTLAAVAVAAMLAFPAGAATWNAYSSHEPSTVYDTDTFMYEDVPPVGSNRVYFNAWTTDGSGVLKGVNPNVAAAKTNTESAGNEQSWALLGVWTDCNGDGYIGLAEGAMNEYPSQLLPAGSPCTARTITPGTGSAACPHKTFSGPGVCPNWPSTGWNNYNGMVLELIPIVGPGARPGGDNKAIRDSAAAIWGDYGRPDDGATGGTCAITPFPRGTLQTSGGILTYTDCHSGRVGFGVPGLLDAWNAAVDAAGDPAGLRFADDDDGRSGQLGELETLGDRYDDPDRDSSPIVKAQDCDGAVLVPFAGTPVASQTESEGVYAPSASVNPDGSVAGTINYTMESGPFPTRQTNAQEGPDSTSNCDGSDDRGDDAYQLLNEGDFNSVSATEKHESDWNFAPVVMTRGGVPLGLGHPGAAGDPNDLGISAFDAVCAVCGRTEWYGGSNTVKAGPQTIVNRGDLSNPAFGVDGGYWLTHYARVGAATTASAGATLPGGGATSEYGFAQCGGIYAGTTPNANGWICAPTSWNKNPDGSELAANGNILATPGLTYQLRDVDCYDGEIKGTGVGVQPAFFGPEPCLAG